MISSSSQLNTNPIDYRISLVSIMFFGLMFIGSSASAVDAGDSNIPSEQLNMSTTNSTPEPFPIVDSSPRSRWKCNCWNSTSSYENLLQCRCQGEGLVGIPQKLHLGMQRLTVSSAGLPRLRKTALKLYAESLQYIMLINLSQFETIESGAFENLISLRTIYIAHAPKLTHLSKDAFKGISESIRTIRIIDSGLLTIPDMTYLPTDTILHLIDLEGNRIKHIDSRSVKVKTEQLFLDNNALTEIDEFAFYGSEIAKLSLRGNSQLQHIHPSAFGGIMHILQLDLSNTALIDLPSHGLQGLEFLNVKNTHSLKTIPSIYNFKNLQVAWLTHSFHCCAFKFPSRHDPSRHAQRIKDLEILQKACRENTPLSEEELNSIQNELGYVWPTESSYSSNVRMEPSIENSLLVHQNRKRLNRDAMTRYNFAGHFEKGDSSETESQNHSHQDDSSNSFIHTTRWPRIVRINDYRTVDLGEFHDTTADLSVNNNFDALCGNFTQKKTDVSCYPMPDALNPCEDVMGSYWLRASVWIVVLLAVFGNFAVLIVLLSSRSDTSVPKFLMSNLAFADLCMGLYLLLIASIDAHSMGEYFNYAFDWQYGAGCKIAGFLTVFASHLSVFTLTIITLERWFAITNAIYLNKRIKIKPAIYIMIIGWIYSFCMSSFPLFGISNYSSTSICLPMEARDPWDVVYLVSILGMNGAAFFVIAICYGQIYFSLGKKTRRSSSTGEMTVAKKMALLVFTNFSCWAPIAFFGLTALAGYPLINITKSKILLVFFYPLNSCADPYLYAILTAQYRRDLYLLLSKFGICQQKAAQYRSSFSLPGTHQTNQTIPINLNRRDSPGLTAQKSLEGRNMLSTEDFV